MTTNFALSLSFEGIELLHRVQHGWQRVGRADVEDENLDAALADLRAKAEALEPDGLRTKLIIPLDQIKYVAIDSTQTSEEDINAELDGATPYGLNELVIDFERFGGRTHIAAVARETLIEAETFAHAHGFNPVCFVAVPEPFTFQKEVFFGPTSMMRDVLGWDGEVERDPLPVMVVGTRIKSRLLVFDLPEDAIPPGEDDLDLTADLSKSEKTTAQNKADVDEAPSGGFDLAAALAPFVEDSPETEKPKDEPQKASADDADKVEDQPALPLPMEEAAPPAPVEAKEVEPEPDDQPATVEEAETVVVAAAQTPARTATDTPGPAQPALLDAVITEVMPAVTMEPGAEPSVVEELKPAEPARVEMPDDLVLFAPPLLDPIVAEYHSKPKLIRSRRQRSRLIALAPPNTAPPPKVQPVKARPIPPVETTNDNRRPGLIAGAIAASIVVVGVVAWALLRNDEPETILEDPTAIAVEEALQEAAAIPAAEDEVTGTAPSTPQVEVADFAAQPTVEEDAGVAGTIIEAAPGGAEPQSLTAATEPDVVPGPQQPAPAPPAQEQAAAEVGAPILRGRVLSPADAARIYAATGVWQRAPRFVDVPGTTSTAGMIVPIPDTVPGRLVQPEAPLGDDLATDQSFLAPADPPPADVAFPLDADGFILATPEGTVTPEGAVVFAGAPDLTIRLRPELSPEDLERMALLAPAPEGVVIVAGRPEVIPPLRPADAALPEQAQDEADTADANDVAPDAAATPGGVALSALESQTASADPELAGARPETRPSDLASTARPADPGTPDITAIIAGIEAEDAANSIVNATPQAVVASLRPSLRPGNFDRVVAAARARIEEQQAAPAPAPAAPVRTAAPVAPQNYAPVPGGVARAATQEDVIRLRQMNLIGVYGRPNARRALVRLSNGRYVRVEVGSALDGGQVTAIGESALNYVKRGRTYALELPSG